MLEQLEKEQPIFYKQAIIPIKSKKINHAYLLETNNINEVELTKIIEEMIIIIFEATLDKNSKINKEKLEYLLRQHQFPDLLEITPINNMIKKEQLLKVMHQFQKKSVYGTCQMYIVYDADKLNSNAANTILKFLEEPEDNIIAIFVTNNRYKIMNTILSRCTILTLINREKFKQDNIEEPLLELIENIKNREKIPLLLNFKKYSDTLFYDKATANDNLLILKKYYKNILEQKSMEDIIDLTKILEIINILEQAIKKLKYNINIKLWLDSLLLKLTEV